MKTRYPWVQRLKKSAPELPLEPPVWLDSWSNGEAFFEQTLRDRRIKKRIFDLVETNAKRVGVDRREFVASAMGMATSLWVIGCSDEAGNGDEKAKPVCYDIPKDALFDESLACSVLGGDEFIFDIQTHHYVEGTWKKTNPQYKLFFDAAGWSALTRDEYIQRLYLESQTHVTVLSGLPSAQCSETLKVGCGLPISNEEIAASRDIINKMANSIRLLNHAMVTPNTEPEIQLQLMEHYACEVGVAGWKMYPGYFGLTGKGYFLDEEPYGLPFIEKGIALGVPIFCIHKGLPIGNFFDTEHNQPRDVGVVAKKYPEAKFIIYHSAICAGIATAGNCPETPYDEADPAPKGSNQLIRSLIDNGIGPGQNVYAELGTALGSTFRNGTADHFLGKLMKYVGENNVLWGSDAMNGLRSPQPLIEQFRAFTIPQALIDQYGYPELTPERKRKILGLNSATVFGLDPKATRCALEGEPTAKLKQLLDGEYGDRRWTQLQPPGPTSRREFLAFRKSLNGMPG